MDAFDADALIYAAVPGHQLGRRVAALFRSAGRGPVDRATAELATVLASKYRLKAADATHLATAVNVGADRFITSNQRDFPATITEVTITYPAELK
jgi:predicted nucleic acid-binding protein